MLGCWMWCFRVGRRDRRLGVTFSLPERVRPVSCALGILAAKLSETCAIVGRVESMHTGGSMLPRAMGCGATRAEGAEGAVSAQNQPIMNGYCAEG